MPRTPGLHDQGSHLTFLPWLEFPGEAVQVVTEALTWEREVLGSWLRAERPGLPRAAQREWAASPSSLSQHVCVTGRSEDLGPHPLSSSVWAWPRCRTGGLLPVCGIAGPKSSSSPPCHPAIWVPRLCFLLWLPSLTFSTSLSSSLFFVAGFLCILAQN